MALTELSWDDFTGGLNTEKPRTRLDRTEYAGMNNLLVRPYAARVTLRPGEHQVFSTASGILGFTSAIVSGVPYIIYATPVSGVANVIAYNRNTLASTVISSTGSVTHNYEFEKFSAFGRDKVFWADGNSQLMEWSGGGVGSATTAGILAPGAALVPTGSSGTPGGLKGGRAYAWYYTYGTADGLESNPSPITLYFSELDPSNPSFTYGKPLTTITPSGDARVDRRYIYRVGDNITIPTRVGTIFDNTTTTFTDTVADLNAGTIQLSFNHDIPVGAIEYLVKNKSRMVLSKNYTIYVSSLGRPEYYPVTYLDPINDGVQFNVDPDSTNPIMGLGTNGSATIIARRKNIYLLQGQDADQMTLNKICDIGCISGRTLKMCSQSAVWMAPDSAIWILGSGAPQRLGAPIDRTLQPIPQSWLPRACATYWNNHYVICIPGPLSTDLPYVYAFDFYTETWTDLSQAYMSATQLYSDQGLGDLSEILLATAIGYKKASNNAVYTGLVSTMNSIDEISAAIDLKGSYVRPFGPAYNTRVQYVRVRGKFTGTANITITAFRFDNTTIAYTYPMTASATDSAALIEKRVDSDLVGRDVTWEITGTVSVCDIEEVTLGVSQGDYTIN